MASELIKYLDESGTQTLIDLVKKSIPSIPGDASFTDTKVNVTLGTTTKAYLLGTSMLPTNTPAGTTAVANTGVYLDTTTGKLTATSFAGNGASLTNLNAGNITSGTLDVARLPDTFNVKIVNIANEDLNNYTTNGYYYFSSSYTPKNIPAGANGWLSVVTNKNDGSGTVVKQIWYRHGSANSNDYETYIRTRVDTSSGNNKNGWSEWAQILTGGDVLVTSTSTTGSKIADIKIGSSNTSLYYQPKSIYIDISSMSTDLNDYKEPGEYYFGTGDLALTNIPNANYGSGAAGWLTVMSASNNSSTKQIWHNTNSSGLTNHRMFVRSKLNGDGEWSRWREMITTGDHLISGNDKDNLNDYVVPGIYYISKTIGQSATASNFPSTAVNGWLTVMTSADESVIKQIFYRHGTADSNDFQTFVRTRIGSTWSGWKKFFTDGDTISITNGGTGATTANAARTNLSALGGDKGNTNYYGLVLPDNTTSDYLRTTSSGLVPSVQDASNGSGNIGTSTWPFKNIYAKTLNGTNLILDDSSSDAGSSIQYNSSTRTGSAISFIPGDKNGSGIRIGEGGLVVIGSGESSDNYMTAENLSPTTETLHLTSDSSIYFATNCNTIGNRVIATLDTEGNFKTASFVANGAKPALYLKDSSGYVYPGIVDNGTNLWIGSLQTAAQHHTGKVYISTGYDSSSSTGNDTIYVSVPNNTNTGATNYAVLHKNNTSFEPNTSHSDLYGSTDGYRLGTLTIGGTSTLLKLKPYALIAQSSDTRYYTGYPGLFSFMGADGGKQATDVIPSVSSGRGWLYSMCSYGGSSTNMQFWFEPHKGVYHKDYLSSASGPQTAWEEFFTITDIANGSDIYFGNVDNAMSNGIYYISSAFNNSHSNLSLPNNCGNGWLIVMTNEAQTVAKQIFFRQGTADTNDYQTYLRTYTGNKWSSWRMLTVNTTNTYSLTGNANTGIPIANVNSITNDKVEEYENRISTLEAEVQELKAQLSKLLQ